MWTGWCPFGESSARDKQGSLEPSKHHAAIATVWGEIPYLRARTERRDSTCVLESISGSADLESVTVGDSRDGCLFTLFFSRILRGGTLEDSPTCSASCILSESLGLSGGILICVTDSVRNLRPFSSRDLSLRDRPRPPKTLRGTCRTGISLQKRLGGPWSSSWGGGRPISWIRLFIGRMGGLSCGRRGGGNLEDELEEDGGPDFDDGGL